MNDVIERNFSHHKAIDEDVIKMEMIRQGAKEFAKLINELCPEGREKSLAFTNLEQVMFWAVAGIARKD
jgi:hypothetical protein